MYELFSAVSNKQKLNSIEIKSLKNVFLKRIGLSLLHTLTDECKACKGLGRIESNDYLITKVENWIKKFKSKFNDRTPAILSL